MPPVLAVVARLFQCDGLIGFVIAVAARTRRQVSKACLRR